LVVIPKFGCVLLAFENLFSRLEIELGFYGFSFIDPITDDDFFAEAFFPELKKDSFSALNYLYVVERGDWT
jgi:hypothetical protein